MSGHSKWANIQATKTVTDKKRAAVFTKYARLVTVAAREGGSADPEKNFKLRVAIDKARGVNMPKENIERAAARGAGGVLDARMEHALYEALMLNGRCGLMIECLTDNKNRTLGELKTVLGKHGAALAASGAVQWMFDRRGVIRIENARIQDGEQLALIDAGASDFIDENNGATIYTAPHAFHAVLEKLRAFGHESAYAELAWVAKNPIAFSDEEQNKIAAVTDALEEEDDVQHVFANAA